MSDLILVHGAMRSGKTTFCRNLHARFERAYLERTWPDRPFAVIEENERDADGLPVLLRFNRLGPVPEGEAASMELGQRLPGSCQGGRRGFSFRAEAFGRVRAQLSGALAQGCNPVILDEIGRLEAQEGKGLFDCLSLLTDTARGRGDLLTVLSMREEYAAPLLGRLGIGDSAHILRIDAGSDPEALAEKLMARMHALLSIDSSAAGQELHCMLHCREV
jgi:hypothetical protein